jgi:hypothetical protein
MLGAVVWPASHCAPHSEFETASIRRVAGAEPVYLALHIIVTVAVSLDACLAIGSETGRRACHILKNPA